MDVCRADWSMTGDKLILLDGYRLHLLTRKGLRISKPFIVAQCDSCD